MSAFLSRMLRLIIVYLGAPLVPTIVTKKAAVSESADQSALTGRFHFRERILDQLDSYFAALGRLQRADLDTYHLFASVGAVIVPEGTEMDISSLEARWTRSGARPFAGGVFFGLHDKNDDNVPIWFGFFQRLKAPPEGTERARGAIYRVIGLWKDIVADFCVAVSDDGKSVRLLREQKAGTRTIQGRARGRNRRFSVPDRSWAYPYVTRHIAGRRNERPQDVADTIFRWLVNTHESANADIRVRVAKGSRVATFGVDMLRTPYFFNDRDISTGDTGRRRKIFHIVRAHERFGASGKRSVVKTHFRGERRFRWNGYDVNVTLPGKHHREISSLEVGGEIVDLAGDMSGKYTSRQVGRLIDEMANV